MAHCHRSAARCGPGDTKCTYHFIRVSKNISTAHNMYIYCGVCSTYRGAGSPSQKRNCELMSVCVYRFRNCLARGVGRNEDCPIGSGRGQAIENDLYLSFILRIQRNMKLLNIYAQGFSYFYSPHLCTS